MSIADATLAPQPGPTSSLRLERTLREQQTLLDSAGVGIVFIRNRVVVRCNPRYAEIFRLHSPDEAIGCSSERLHPNQDAFRELGRVSYPIMAGGDTYRAERQMRRADGQLFWSHLTGRLINPCDSAEGSIWIVDDIDDYKRAEARFSTAEREKQLLFDNAMVGIVVLRERRMVRCNRHFEQLLGYGPGELQGQPSRIWYLSDADWEDVGQRCYTPLLQGKTFEGQVTLRAKDGRAVVCEVRSKAVDPQDFGQGTIWIVMDVSERLRIQARMAKMHDELEQQVRERTRELRETVNNLHAEIDKRRLDQERIHWMAHYDTLTRLPNRMLLSERGQLALQQAQEQQTPLAVMFLDLDNFKHVNDSLGHRVGDTLLVEFAKRLSAVVRERDTVARLGGDEFVLLLPRANAQGAARVAAKLQAAASQPFQVGHHELGVALSMGIALYPEHGDNFEALIQAADTAMYRAKAGGRNSFRIYTPEMQAQAIRALQLGNALPRALERRQLQLHYQPQVSLVSGKLCGVEALLRWQHPELGAVAPSEFIPVAEDNAQILQIGEWALREALAQLKVWRAAGLTHLTMAVNLSAVQFREPRLPLLVESLLAEYDIPADCLELELTENVAISDPRAAIATMDELHAKGVRMAVDDFGTGYSSLSQLKRFQIYRLKIDQSFVRDLDQDVNDRAIVSAIIRMAQALGMHTTAEGVETAGQLDFLRAQGCDEAQGYYFSKPMPAAALADFLQQRAA